MYKHLILAIYLLFGVGVSAQVKMSANTSADIYEIKKLTSLRAEFITENIRKRFPINTFGASEYVAFIAKKSAIFSRSVLISNGVMLGAEIGDIITVKYPLESIESIYNDPNFLYIELAGMIKPTLDRVPWDVRADSVWMGYGMPNGFSGDEVIIGVQDWGFDYTSPMFYDTTLSNSRILAAWDQFKTSGPAPLSYGYGTEYSSVPELLTAGSDTSNIYSYSTHGTHVAGIAGGSGAGTEYRGITFESSFLFATFLVNEVAVIDSWDWMYQKAQDLGKRLVVNMSWGLYNMQSIDGTSLLSQALDSYSDLGVVFCTSAGNNGSTSFHIKQDFANDTLLSRIDFYSSASLNTLWGQSIHMTGEPGEYFSSGIRVLNNMNQVVGESDWYSTSMTTNYIDTFLLIGTDSIFFNLSADAAYPTNGRPQTRLRVKYPPSGYKIVLKSEGTGTVHYWNVTELTSDVGNWGMPFLALGSMYTAGDNLYGIGTPACSNAAISVAAYAPQYYTGGGTLVGGAGANFSSIGPLITDSLKPDIAAPGVQVASSISSFTDAAYSTLATVDFNGRTYPFSRFNGTSMSSPVVAGISALILDANQFLAPYQVKSILKATARTDQYTGVIGPQGDTKWGYGKVNAYQAVLMALNTIGINELEKEYDWEVFPNPTSDMIYLKGDLHNVVEIKIVDMNGTVLLKEKNLTKFNVSPLVSGTYFIRVIRNNKVEQQKFIKL